MEGKHENKVEESGNESDATIEYALSSSEEEEEEDSDVKDDSDMHHIVSMHVKDINRVGNYFTEYIDGDEFYQEFISNLNVVSTRFCTSSTHERRPACAINNEKDISRYSSNGGEFFVYHHDVSLCFNTV